MIDIFKIKKERKNLKVENDNIFSNYEKISKYNIDQVLSSFDSNINGLTNNKAKSKLNINGLNKVIKDDKKSWIYFFVLSFKDTFILILFVLATINFLMGDRLGSTIIVSIAFISAFIRFIQEYSVYKFNRKLKSMIYSSANVLRDNKDKNIKTEQIVVGDIVKLNAGSIIPADLLIINSQDLFINQSVFTGESVPVEKLNINKDNKTIFDISNICLMGSSVISVVATGIVINTGFNTYLGGMGKELDSKKEITNFDKGMKSITNLLIKYMVVVCLVVLIVNGLIKKNISEAILFALSVAVGITPSMLPMIVNINLSKGSKSLAKKKTLVKQIESIQNLGAIDTLCTDKTGTLTEDNITLQKYVDINGNDDSTIINYAYLNSYFGTGMKNLVDRAILSYAKKNNVSDIVNDYEKIDEIPFDYSRKKASVVVKIGNNYLMTTKGALEVIINCCTKVKINNKVQNITDELINKANIKAKELAENGMQVIALAEKKEYSGVNHFNKEDEKDMTFIGFVGFLAPVKVGVKQTLLKLKKAKVNIKILTGDNQYATLNVCNLVGLNGNDILIGNDIDNYTDEELQKRIEEVDVFARLNPFQKERIIRLYKQNNHVVGYMGDGVNDAPSLHQADIGISVNSATDIAKEASNLILLEKNLNVVYDGVIEGRKVYGNIIKYMKMALSDDFGDVFSIMVASIFLPFLPLLPIQMLIQDFIYDFSQIGIPYDNVDEEFLAEPHRWNTDKISKFMKVMGITSSIIDVLAFLVFWFIFGYNSIEKQAYFQTAWFVMCLISELMIIHNVRTSKKPFVESCASLPLLLLTLLSIVLTIITPILFHSISTFNFVILPFKYYIYMTILILLYTIAVTIIKKIYIRKNNEWL